MRVNAKTSNPLLHIQEKEKDGFDSLVQAKALNESLAGPPDMLGQEISFKNRASELVVKKRPQAIGAILNQSKQSNSFGDANKFISNESSVPIKDSQLLNNLNSAEQSLDPAFVMGFGTRKHQGSLLEDSALIQF